MTRSENPPPRMCSNDAANPALMKRVLLIVVPALLATAVPALAQTLYKYQRPDGTVVYSDAPVKGARLLETLPAVPVPPEPAPAPAPAPGAAAPETPAAAEVPPPAPTRTQKLDAADAEVRAAQQALAAAQARVEQGTEPLAGERTMTAGGTSRLNETYFARQRALQEEVERANARLGEAYRKRNDAR
jgi:hypothetical protein